MHGGRGPPHASCFARGCKNASGGGVGGGCCGCNNTAEGRGLAGGCGLGCAGCFGSLRGSAGALPIGPRVGDLKRISAMVPGATGALPIGRGLERLSAPHLLEVPVTDDGLAAAADGAASGAAATAEDAASGDAALAEGAASGTAATAEVAAASAEAAKMTSASEAHSKKAAVSLNAAMAPQNLRAVELQNASETYTHAEASASKAV